MPVIVKPAAGDAPWTTTGNAIIDAVNAIPLSFVDVSYLPAGGQPLTNGVMTKLTLDTEASDVNNLFNTTTNLYTVPTDGVYFIQALVRVEDSNWTTAGGANLGVGVHTSNIDGTWFQWNKVMPLNTGGGRFSTDYTRVATFSATNTLQLYCYQDSGGTLDIFSAQMQIFRIA